MTSITHILCPVDCSEFSLRTLAHTAGGAFAFGALGIVLASRGLSHRSRDQRAQNQLSQTEGINDQGPIPSVA